MSSYQRRAYAHPEGVDVATVDVKQFYSQLVDNGLDFFCGVPDSLLKSFCSYVSENACEGRNIIAANEGNAIGIACGYHVATGKCGVVYMQNSGEGNAVNPLLSIADPAVYSIPMLLIIGWRGEPGVHDEPQHAKQGAVTLSLLEAMNIPYEVLDDNWEKQLRDVIRVMNEESRPAALVIRKGLLSEHPYCPDENGAPLCREEALRLILSKIDDNDFVVSTTGKTSREIFEIRESRGQVHSQDFLTVGGMGHTSSIAFGMAIGSDKNIYCIDGDGSFLMHMGALAIIAQNAPDNFKYILNNNEAHESVGGQSTVAGRIDIPAVLRACGFENVIEARSRDEIMQGMDELARSRKVALVITTHQGSRPDLGRPTITPMENKQAMMKAFEYGRYEDA